MKLSRLPSRLNTLARIVAQPLPAGNTERPAGRAWQATRLRIQVRDGSMCADCGNLWRAERDQADPEIPRWKGGSDEDGNPKLRCWGCHDAKSKREAQERAGMGRRV